MPSCRRLLSGFFGAALTLTSTLIVAATSGAAATAAPAATLTIDTGHTTATVNPTQFGHIVEDINHSVEGGLNANVVRNSTMKEGAANPPASWSLITGGGAAGAVSADTATPLNSANGTSLRLDVTANGAGQRVGAANAGFYGTGVRPRTSYAVSFWARATAGFTGPLTVSLESTGGTSYATATVRGLSTGWKQFTTRLITGGSAPVSTTNRFVIAANGTGTGQSVWLNVVRCLGPTYAPSGGIRADLQKLLAETRPGFFRVPGGNYLEGNVLANRFAWKETVGPVEQRPGHQNDAWGYWSTDQFGLLNYLQMAEQAGAEPMLAVFAGYTLNGSATPQAELAPYVQEALDEIEYATGSTSTTWGAQRAADGHPAPFPLRYVEIGNEDFFDRSGSYNAYRYPAFYDAIKAKYPRLQIVATTAVTSRPMDVLDDHYYQNDPAAFAALASRYDAVDRNGPRILVGEYGVTNGTSSNPTGNLAGALAEAAFLTGTVRNADLVIGSAYAPALTSVDNWQWSSNLIGFNAVSSYGSPSYQVLKMFGNLTGDHVVSSRLTGADPAVQQVATRTVGGTVYLTVVNRTAAALPTRVDVTGARSVAASATTTTLTGDPAARNSITAPDTVVPATGSVAAGPGFGYTFPANSVVVLKLHTAGSATPLLTVGKPVSLRPTATGHTDESLRLRDGLGVTSVITASSSGSDKKDATFTAVAGLADASCYSFTSRNDSSQYLRHDKYRIRADADDGSATFAADATFCAVDGKSGQGVSFRSYNSPTRYLRNYAGQVWIARRGGVLPFDTAAGWAADTSWRVSTGWWRSTADVATGAHSLQATTAGYTGYYLRHYNSLGVISPITTDSSSADKQDATFTVVTGLADNSCYSFEARDFPGQYLRHYSYRIRKDANDGSALFAADATFCAQPGNSGSAISWQSANYPDRFLRHYNTEAWIAADGGPLAADATANWAADSTWNLAAPWAP
jgi:alpha-L-arabinofuranosidase